MVKRLKQKHKGDRLWNAGVFVGKTEPDMWLIAQPAGIHATRSVRPLPEQFDAKRIKAIGTFTWQIKRSMLGILPRKYKAKPTLTALPPVGEAEMQQLEGGLGDEAGSDPPSSDESSKSGDSKVSALGSEAIVAELEETLNEMQDDHEDHSPDALPATAFPAANF